MSRNHDLDQILRKNLGAAYAESTGLVKKEKVNKYKAFAESVKASAWVPQVICGLTSASSV